MSPKIVDKQAKRAQITQAAMQVFAANGFQRTLVEDIAQAAGISKGALYGYFKSKEELFFSSVEAYQLDMVEECMEVLATETTARAKLTIFLRTIIESLSEHLELFPLTLELWAAASAGPVREQLSNRMKGIYSEFRGMTVELIKAGIASGEFQADTDAEAVAGWLVGGADGLMLQYWFDPSLDVKGWLDHFLETMFHGISTPRPGDNL